ncbi:DNA methylase N-4/N-6 domain-containing protein [Halococcus morrhuae DSM 1307]|uniref:Type II methyltransferase n=1 Tax=Halococcus morrhuae DSM 1307 TaxID=931277 RepID=M0M4I4_HALMO|nr:DNA methyltransferase [Halococcus morrhuae]EMA40727.1 DNA methylase N-4/N-6 domain-containing protein [Halococcus morrhuae DSM 1307]
MTFLTLPYEKSTRLPSSADGDPRTPPSYVAHFLTEHTAPDAVVLDPFAGFGTTLAVGERLGREVYGIEYERERVTHIEERIDHPERVSHASALDLPSLAVPAIDCCFTSPPYMVESMGVDPLANYDDASETTYEEYLDAIETVFAHVGEIVVPDGTVLVDVANMKHGGRVTTLAWDVADAVATTFEFRGEVVVGWENEDDRHSDDPEGGTYGYGYDHSYCLVFDAPSQ